MLTGFEKLLLPDILYEMLRIVAHLDEQVDDLCPGLGGQVVEVGKDPAHDETPNLKTREDLKPATIISTYNYTLEYESKL